jgi:hypothetical protein
VSEYLDNKLKPGVGERGSNSAKLLQLLILFNGHKILSAIDCPLDGK